MKKKYVPIVRVKDTYKRVFQKIGGLSAFGENNYSNELLPLVEITDERDLEQLHPYRGAADDLLVELPVYHFTTEEENDLADPVKSLSNEFGGQVEFYLSNLPEIDIPVISGSIQKPFDYGKLVDKYSKLSQESDRNAIRLFVSSRRLSDQQQSSLENLSETMSEEECVLLDVIEVGVKGAVKENLVQISSIFDQQSVVVLNVFNAPEGQLKNEGPHICNELELDGFGDFILGRRYEVQFPYTGPRKIRYYDPTSSEVVLYEGDDYPEAAEKLTEDGHLSSSHCEFCSEGANYSKDGVIKWSRIQNGHYIICSLNEET